MDGSDKPGKPDRPEAKPAKMMFPPPSSQWLGYTFVDIDHAGQAMRVDFTATDEMRNPLGNVQGGILTAMMDDTMGSMVFFLTKGEKAVASVDIHTQFFQPASVGKIRCEARITHIGRTTVFTAADLYDEEGRKLAMAVQTARLTSIKGDKSGGG